MKRAAKLALGFVLAVIAAIAIVFYVKNGGTGAAVSAVSVRLNEVMTSNKGSVPDDFGNYPDWVELYNDSDREFDVSGYGLSDDLIAGAKYVFPAGTVIPANGYLVVYCSGENTAALYAPFKLSAKDDLVFMDHTGKALETIDLMTVEAGKTLSYVGGAEPWQAMTPSPGFENTEAGAAAYESALRAPADVGVYINEFMASNKTTLFDAYGEASDWVELYNANETDVDLSGFGISDNLSQPMKYALPEGTIIPAKGYLVIYLSGHEGKADGADEIHAPFGLRAYEEDVVLTAKGGKVADSYSYARQESDVSMARAIDGSGDFVACTAPTPGYSNTSEGRDAFLSATAVSLSDLYISEVMGLNTATLTAANGETYDWIELHNASASPIQLAGYALSNNANNPAKWVFPDVSIGAGEYMVVFASENDVKDTQKKKS